MKKVCSLLLCLLLLALPITAQAAGYYVVDQAGLLDSASVEALEDGCIGIYNNYGVELVILTVDSLNGESAWDYADSYYESNGYGENGILFLLAMAEREWYISTSGIAIDALHDYALMEIEDEIVPYLSTGQYYEGFAKLQSILPDYLDQQITDPDLEIYYNAQGDHYIAEYNNYHQQRSEINLFFSLIFGAVIAFFGLMGMRSTMNTKKAQRGAADYQTEGSYHLTQHQDLFLYSNITKHPRQQNTSSPGARSGGSSVHHSSSGRSHGGRGGRF